jgi:methylenetetrahydrofolate reductase (NADPH)
MRHGNLIGMIQPPHDPSQIGRSTWAAVMRGGHDDNGRVKQAVTSVPQRPAAGGRSRAGAGSALETKLGSGAFCVTAEFNPPDSADRDVLLVAAAPLLEICDAINVTDGAGANTHISSMAVCALLARAGAEPVMQVSCRDRNRIAIQADVLGAAALGIENVLCLTGDGMKPDDDTAARPVFDLDCTSLLSTLTGMRDKGSFLSGKAISAPPELFLGATSNPCAIEPEIEVARLAKKIAAGARFIQSQFVFDVPAFEAFFSAFRARGLDRDCHYLVGLGPLASAKSAVWMRDNIAGLRIPDTVISRLERAKDQTAEGLAICIETIAAVRAMSGVAGIHIMAFQQPDAARRIVYEAGLKPS